MPLLSDYSRRKKTDFFIETIPREARVLEIGCGARWVEEYMRAGGWKDYVGLDLFPPADIVGDILNWRELGLEPASFDVVIAFEVVEHVDCFQAIHDLLKQGGRMMLTSPEPATDWVCWLLERIGLSQKRTSPHDHLVKFADIALFEPVAIRKVGLLAQWGIFQKP